MGHCDRDMRGRVQQRPVKIQEANGKSSKMGGCAIRRRMTSLADPGDGHGPRRLLQTSLEGEVSGVLFHTYRDIHMCVYIYSCIHHLKCLSCHQPLVIITSGEFSCCSREFSIVIQRRKKRQNSEPCTYGSEQSKSGGAGSSTEGAR